MSSDKEVVIEFDIASGNPTVSVKGMAGRSCKQETADIEASLGKAAGSRKTADYAKAEETKNRASQQG